MRRTHLIDVSREQVMVYGMGCDGVRKGTTKESDEVSLSSERRVQLFLKVQFSFSKSKRDIATSTNVGDQVRFRHPMVLLPQNFLSDRFFDDVMLITREREDTAEIRRETLLIDV